MPSRSSIDWDKLREEQQAQLQKDNPSIVDETVEANSALTHPEVLAAYREIENEIIELIKIQKDDPYNMRITMEYRNHLCIVLSLWSKMGEVIEGRARPIDLVQTLNDIDRSI